MLALTFLDQSSKLDMTISSQPKSYFTLRTLYKTSSLFKRNYYSSRVDLYRRSNKIQQGFFNYVLMMNFVMYYDVIASIHGGITLRALYHQLKV